MLLQNDCFAELGGFVLVDPARLSEFYGGSACGRDLVTAFTTTDEGDRVVTEGIVIPLLGLAPGFYQIAVRRADEPPCIAVPLVTAPGWVLGTTTGELLICGLGYLTKWNEEQPSHRKVTVEPGWYSVEIRAALLEDADEEGLYELVLTPVTERPTFTASLSESLSLLD
jgi:hypothetical protein